MSRSPSNSQSEFEQSQHHDDSDAPPRYSDQFPVPPVLTSNEAGWSSVSLEYYHHPLPTGETPKLCFDHYAIAVTLGQEFQLDWQGQEPKLDLKIISSSKQLASLLSVDASASLRVKTKGNVSAQASFSDQQQINSYYQYALVTVSVTNPTELIRDPVLKENARKLLESDGWEEFAKSYGLEFVEGYIPGGYYYALIEIQTTDSSKQQEIAAQLSGSYSGFGADAKATAEAGNKIKTALKDQKISVSVCQSGGSGDPLEVTLDKMIEQAINFPALIKENPVFMTAITNTYQRAVPDLPKPKGSQSFWNTQTNTLNELGEQYLELDDYKSNLEFVLKNLDKFGEFDELARKEKRSKFQASLEATKKAIDVLVKQAKSCSEDSSQCASYTLPETFEYLELPGGRIVDLNEMEATLKQLTTELEALKKSTIREGQEIFIKSHKNQYLQQALVNHNDSQPDATAKWSRNASYWELLTIVKRDGRTL